MKPRHLVEIRQIGTHRLQLWLPMFDAVQDLYLNWNRVVQRIATWLWDCYWILASYYWARDYAIDGTEQSQCNEGHCSKLLFLRPVN